MKLASRPMVALVAALLTTALPFPANSQEDARTVSVNGTVTTYIKADQVNWSLTVSTDHQDLQQAVTANDQSIERLLRLREKFRINANDIQTGKLRIQKVYERDEFRNRGEFRFYTVSRSVSLQQEDLAKFDELLSELSTLPDIEMSYQLASSEFHRQKRETRIQAVEVAREKAEDMVTALDAELGKVVRIEENNGPTASFGSNNFVQRGEPVSDDEIGGSFAPGMIPVRISVSVVFEIE